MRGRLQRWLEETHSTDFELLRHFLELFFDGEAVSSPGEWKKVAAGGLAALLSAGILGVNVYWERYAKLWNHGTPALFRAAMGDDMASFIDIAMAITALLTILQWQALFPSRHDCLVFAGMPVSARQIFTAKFGALVLIFTAFVLALTLIPSILFAAVTAYPWRDDPSFAGNVLACFASTAGACAFAFFSLLAVQGILLNVLPGRMFTPVSSFVQGALFIVILGSLPFIGDWPRFRPSLPACIIPTGITGIAYALTYRRYRRQLIEAHVAAPYFAEKAPPAFDKLCDALLPDPRAQAAFAFIWKTLVRSRGHRLILLAYAGIAIGCIAKGALDTGRPSLHDQGIYGFIAVFAPLAMATMVTAGLRYLFSLPVTPGANWMFQTNERECRGAWLQAVERFVEWCGIAPVLLISLPAQIAIFGAWRAVSVAILVLFGSLIAFEFLFRRWNKLPFTCSHLPGKRPILATLLMWGFSVAWFATAGQLILYCSGEPTAFVALAAMECVIWWRLRKTRGQAWTKEPLCFEDKPADAPVSLNLEPTESALHAAQSSATAPSLFDRDTLVASRGLLPAEWQDEIESEARRPSALAGSFLEDIRYGLRVIRCNPLLSTVVIVTLTIGIGINASVFTVINGLALRAHVYKDPQTFIRIIARNQWRDTLRFFGYSEYNALRDRSQTLRQLAAYSLFPAFIGEDDPAGSSGLAVSCNFFAVDGLDRAMLGRLFAPEDCAAPGTPPPAILNESVWRARFASDPNIIGQVIQLNSRPVIVAGVVPARTSGWTIPAKVWLPFPAMQYLDPSIRYLHQDEELWLQLAGRLVPGYTRSQAQAELNILIRGPDSLHAGRRTRIVTTDGSWMEELNVNASGRDLMLIAFFLGAFALVLFIACANVGTLLLSRAAAREREIAVRLSLGAPRIRLVRMLVTESLLLSVIAGAISLLLAWKLPVPLFHLVATGAPEFPMPPDWHIFAYLCLTVLAAGLLSGLAPAIESVKIDLLGSLKGYGGLLLGAGGSRLRNVLISTQVALSMVLLVEAFLFGQSEDRNLRASPGFRPERVVVSMLHFAGGTTIEQAKLRLETIADRIRRLPGAHSVAFSSGLPMMVRDTVEVRPPLRADALQPVDIYQVSPGFFETLGIGLVSGRDFRESDGFAVVISENLARLFWHRENVVGKTMPLPMGAVTIVGVARDVAPMRFGGSDNPAVYVLRRIDPHLNFLAVRFDSDTARGVAAVRAALHQTDPDLFIVARALQSWIDQVTRILWNVVALILILGVLATALAAAGIYGAVRFAVGQRTRELGIRIALGARWMHIIREVFISSGKPVGAGLLQGLWLSVASAAVLRHNLQGSPIRLDTTNPFLYLGAVFILALAAVAAMIGPAYRGSRCDPLDALRCD